MLILLKKDKIISCIITICIIVGLLLFANINKGKENIVETWRKLNNNTINNIVNE